MSDLATWQEQLRALDPVVDDLVEIWRPDGAPESAFSVAVGRRVGPGTELFQS